MDPDQFEAKRVQILYIIYGPLLNATKIPTYNFIQADTLIKSKSPIAIMILNSTSI